MNDENEIELKIALEKGFISPAEVSALREEASLKARSPLRLLQDQGLISEQTLVAIREAQLKPPVAGKGNLAGAATLTTDVVQHDSMSADGAFPVPGWERYQFLRPLGAGGMGQVFLAYDPRLRRNVALKFVREQDTELTRRLVSEARAQARVSHQHVCHVYEVGEVQGLPYIAMHHVDGQPLSHFVDRLTVAQKALVLRDAAAGIHAAHSVGLIHRDIKPSNILVEQTADGRLHPYVMDFGLARDWREKGATATGSVVGTPHYMAPEQARGEVASLDWRADVYSLGATFYHLLTGNLPIPGENGLEVINNIATVEPRPPRALDPRIPADLEAIVLKCLEKERPARYDSMLALIEDLDRFLAGEPVKARSTGLGYQVYKKARKHQRLMAMAAVALLAVASALWWAAWREDLARSFTEKVERIESRARLSALSPLHDTHKDREDLRKLIASLEAEIQDAGILAGGLGQHALGRAYLALGEEDKARQYLEAAWNDGFHSPDTALALARVLSRQYRNRLLEAGASRLSIRQHLEAARFTGNQRSGAPSRAEDRGAPPGLDKQNLEKLYLEPALRYLRQAADEHPLTEDLSQGAEMFTPAWWEALFAIYGNDLDEAFAMLEKQETAEPWSYEVLQLRGDILRVRAARRVDETDVTRAREDLDAARRAYADAAAIGRSEFTIHMAQAQLELTELIMDLFSRSSESKSELQDHFSRGLEAVARARSIEPDSVEALLLEADLYARFAEHHVNGASESSPLPKARKLVEDALNLDPKSVRAHLMLAQILVLEGQNLANQGKDPRGKLREARKHFDQVGPKDQDAAVLVHIGLLSVAWAAYESDIFDGKPLPHLGNAIEAYHQAIVHDPSLRAAWINLASAHIKRESISGNPDPDRDLKDAWDALARAEALGPRHALVHYYKGFVSEQQAARSHASGAGAREELLRKAREQYEGAIAIKNDAFYAHDRLGFVWLELAREAWMQGGDPFPLLDRAEKSYEQAFAVAPSSFIVKSNMCDVLVQRALYQRARGESPEASLRSALETLTSVREHLEDISQFWTNLGTVHVLMAGFELDRRRDPSKSLQSAKDALKTAWDMEKGDAQTWLYLGQLRGLQVRWRSLQSHRQSREEEFKQAESEFKKAIDLATESHDTREPEYRLAFGQFYCEWASRQRKMGGSPGEALTQGLDQVKAVLRVRPKMPDALKLRDCQCAEAASCP